MFIPKHEFLAKVEQGYVEVPFVRGANDSGWSHDFLIRRIHTDRVFTDNKIFKFISTQINKDDKLVLLLDFDLEWVKHMIIDRPEITEIDYVFSEENSNINICLNTR